jgi:hypothetical protein
MALKGTWIGLWSAEAADRLLAIVVSACWLIHALYQFPVDYLLLPDREIWLAQAATWFALLGEAFVLALVVQWGLTGLRRLTSRPDLQFPFAQSSLKIEPWLASRYAPLAAGLLSALMVLYGWRGLNEVPIITDESAYLLQAKLLLSGHWKAPAAPIPEFFEQMYVFVSPFIAGKYPPGFPLVLVPGVALGLPALMPVILVGLTGGLIFALAREITNPWLALLAWLFWSTDPRTVCFPPPYMSQHLAAALWLLCFWGLNRWSKKGGLKYLLLVGVSIGWGAITRPLTMFAAALPSSLLILWLTIRRKTWGQLAIAAGTGFCVLLLLPLQNVKTTGDWKLSPLVLHIRWYTPYDALGFGRTAPEPLRAMPDQLKETTRYVAAFSRVHTWKNLPRIAASRLIQIRKDTFPRWRLVLLPLAAFALFWIPREGLFVSVVALLDFALYLSFPHPPHWCMYYLETHVVLAFLAAAGLWKLTTGLFEPRSPLRRGSLKGGSASRSAVSLVLVILVALPSLDDLYRYQRDQWLRHAAKAHFRDRIGEIPDRKAVVFIRYSKTQTIHPSLVENDPDLEHERIWLVFDRGADNARLRKIAPDRRPYLYLQSRDLLVPLDREPNERIRRILESDSVQ